MPLPPTIATAIESGDTVVTSSARAARALRRLHGEAQRKQGREAWLSADILHWDGWLDRLWQKLLRSGSESRLLLTPLQEQQLWARLVEPGIAGKHLISVLNVSELSQSAYALLGAYNALDFLGQLPLGGYDVEHFRVWALNFEQRCREEDWLSRSLLPLALREAIERGRLEFPGKLLLVGFDRITPAQQRLIEALRKKRVVKIAGPGDVSSAPPQLVKATDKNDEIATCALWLRHQLNALGAGARIAVVVPDVASRRSEIERTFRHILAPETALIGVRDLPPPFEFSLGVPLAQLPMVRAALLLLRWMHSALPQEDASWLLLSGMLCQDEAEQLAIARLDARQGRQPMRQPELELDNYLQLLDKGIAETAPLGWLRRRLLTAQRSMPDHSDLSFAQWVQRAGQMLDAAQWPGAQPLTSEDFQVKARWAQLLDGLAALAFDGRRVPYAEFLRLLEQQARQTIYAPESRDASIQVLGPFEAAGLTFDALWFLGADEAGWPPIGRPHPFLTRSLQRRHEMPHASSEADWKLTQQVTTRLTQSAPLCVFSYAAQTVDGACRPSVLTAPWTPENSAAAWRAALDTREDLAAMHDRPSTQLEREPAIVVPWPAAKDAGGASVLRNQAACPFRAFATRRLAASSLDETDWGLDPRERGSVVHTVLEKLWAQLIDRDGLVRARSEGRLTLLIGYQLDEAFKKYREDGQKKNWNTAYLAAEHARVLSIIEDWLAYEAKRVDFTVEGREDKRTAAVGALQLQLRVDRVDRVGDGRVIIDYKTGMVKTESWDGPRPDDPQLPIYAGFCQVENVQGVLLGRVAEGRLEFIGRVVNNNALFLNGTSLVKPPFSGAMLEEWKANLLNLAEQFLRGEAQVDPKQYPKTCKFCDLPGLCRVAESGRGTREAEAGEGDPD